MTGMPSCPRCGAELPAAARFCPACGRPVEPEFGPPAPPPTGSIWSGLQLPAWLTTDWALVGLGTGVLLGLLFAASAVFGLAAAVGASGSFKAAPCGAAVGAHLSFAALGGRVAAACRGDHGSVLVTGFLPLPWALVAGVATEAALGFAWRRLPEESGRRVAYAAKLALTSGVALGVIAGLASRGDPTGRDSAFAARLNGGEVWFYGMVLIWFWAWLGLRRRGVRLLPPAPEALRRLGRLARDGALVFATLAAGVALFGLVVALAVTEGLHHRIGLVFGFPVVGLSFGAALVDAAMGAALGGVAGHSSLAHFGLPAGDGAGAAPLWLFPAVLLAPAAVAAAVWRRLDRERPTQEQAALAVGAATAVGFAGAAWLATLAGRIVLLAGVNRISQFTGFTPLFNRRETVGTLLALRPNPAAVLGLAVFWGLAGGLGAAFVWASRHNARWHISGAGGGGAPPSAASADPGWDPGPPPVPPTEVLPPSAAPTEVVAPTEVAPPGPERPPTAPPDAWPLPESQDAGAGEEPPEGRP